MQLQVLNESSNMRSANTPLFVSLRCEVVLYSLRSMPSVKRVRIRAIARLLQLSIQLRFQLVYTLFEGNIQ